MRNGEATWRLDAIARAISEHLPGLELKWTGQPGDATKFARQAADQGASTVWALGGDGTLREAAAGLLGSPTALGPLAGGTTNVLIQSLGLPTDPLSLVEAIYARGKPRVRPFDVGLCCDQGGRPRPFLMMASRGLDSRALHGLAPEMKAKLGRGAIAWRAFGEWLRQVDAPFEIELPVSNRDPEKPGELLSESEVPLALADECHQACFFSACNIAHYGGRFVLSPSASPFDGQLDLVGLSAVGRLPIAGFALDLLRATALGRSPDRANVWRRRGRRVVLPGNGPALVQLDGDGFELMLPIEIRLAADRLALLVA